MYYVGEVVRLRSEFFSAHEDGDLIDAISIGEEMIRLYQENDDQKSVEYAGDLNNLAIAYDDICNFKKALALYREAAAVKKALFGEQNESYADTLNNIAVVYSHLERYQDAEKMHRQVLTLREKILGRNHPDYILSLYNLANANEDLGNHKAALELNKKALQRAQRQPRFLKSDLADVLSSLGRQNHALGRDKDALKNYERALLLMKETSGVKSFYYLSNLLGAAEAAKRMKKVELAIGYLKQALEVRKNMMERAHLDYITNLNSLASLYLMKEDYQNALFVHQEVLELIERIMGKEHIFYADELGCIGDDYAAMGQFEEALAYHKEGLLLKERTIGKEHSHYALSLVGMGNLYVKMGQEEEALAYFKQAAAAPADNFSEKNRYAVDSYNCMAELYRKQRQFDKAKICIRKALELRLGGRSEKDGGYAWNLQKLAEIHVESGDIKEGLAISAEALSIRKEAYGEQHPRFARGLRALGDLKLLAKDFSGAQAACQKALGIMEEFLGSDTREYQETVKALADAYFQGGSYAEAVRFYKKRLELLKGDGAKEQGVAAGLSIMTARCYAFLGELGQALDYFERAALSFRAAGLFEDTQYAALLLDMAGIKERQGEYLPAQEMLSDAAKKVRQADGQKSELYLEIQLLLADVLFSAGKEDGAVSVLFEAQRIFCTQIENSQASRVFSRLGDYYYRKRQMEQALSAYENACQGADGQELARVSFLCGHILLQKDDGAKAAGYLQAARKSFLEMGMDHSGLYASVLLDLGKLCDQALDFENAVALYQSGLEIRRTLEIQEEEDSIPVLIRMGELLRSQNKLREAVEATSQASLLIRDFYGEHALYAEQVWKLSLDKYRLEKSEESMRLISRAEEILIKVFGPEGEALSGAFLELGELFLQEREQEQARGAFERAFRCAKDARTHAAARERLLELYKKSGDMKKFLKLKLGK